MSGQLEVIVGCMFSGKTEELLRRINLARIAELRVVVCKPARDIRSNGVQSRDGRQGDAVSVARAEDILAVSSDADVVGIDEAQFFNEGILGVIGALYALGKRIIIAGLDTDFRGLPFGEVHRIMAIPEAEISRQRAVCMRCKQLNATRSHRRIASTEQIVIGDKDTYEALCFSCYQAATAKDDQAVTATVPATAATAR